MTEQVGVATISFRTKNEPPQRKEVQIMKNTATKDHLTAFSDPAGARVTVSLEMKDSDYGTGYGAHVSVSLTAKQDKDSVMQAYAEALDMAKDFVNDAHKQASQVFSASRE